MIPDFIGPDIEAELNWLELTDSIAAGHHLPKAKITDSFLYRGTDTLLSRAAWVEGLGALVKTATIFPGNVLRNTPSVNGAAALFSDSTGELEAMVDFHLLTKWKTAGDSLCAARHLARPDSRKITLVGAGAVSKSMHAAYSALFPDAEFTIWSRKAATAEDMARGLPRSRATQDLKGAVENADIVCTATMSTEPVLQGGWLRTGQHIDLIGAFRPDMREADDTAMRRAALFVDSFDTTLAHIGELKIPLDTGTIQPTDIRADFYGISDGSFKRLSEDSITICKNGGGAHLDLMTARYFLEKWRAQSL